MGLNDKLKAAATPVAIDKLLLESVELKDASPKTKRRWKYVAARRLKELQQIQEAKAASDKKAENAEKSNRSNKGKKQKK